MDGLHLLRKFSMLQILMLDFPFFFFSFLSSISVLFWTRKREKGEKMECLHGESD